MVKHEKKKEEKREEKTSRAMRWPAAEVRVLRGLVDKLAKDEKGKEKECMQRGQGGARATTLSATASGMEAAEED